MRRGVRMVERQGKNVRVEIKMKLPSLSCAFDSKNDLEQILVNSLVRHEYVDQTYNSSDNQ